MKVRRLDIEAGLGHSLFTTKDPESWKSSLEKLGKLCADIWRDDLPEEDRPWVEARREELGRWGDALQRGKEPAPPWPMLLAAIKRAFFTLLECMNDKPEGQRSAADPAARLSKTYLWQTLYADDASGGDRPEALRAFQRGWRFGQRDRIAPPTRKDTTPIVDPPFYWGMTEFPGPRATRERALRASLSQSKDPEGSKAIRQALRELYASAWRDDVPEEDREWAEAYRRTCVRSVNHDRWNSVAQHAYEGYLQSSGGVFGGKPAPPWPALIIRDAEPWEAFVRRVEEAPADEPEPATAEAAAREYWDTLWQESPPLDSDRAREHWLAAVRAAREALAAYVPPTK